MGNNSEFSSESQGKDDQKKTINWWRAILTGVIVGILITAVLVISQYVNLLWGVFLFVVPISAGIVVFSLEEDVMPTFIFFMMLASFTFALSISTMYAMITNGYSRAASIAAFYLLWLITTGIFFYLFRERLDTDYINNHKCKKD